MRADNFARMDDAANEAITTKAMGYTLSEMEKSGTPLPWRDPVKTYHVRQESDAVFLF